MKARENHNETSGHTHTHIHTQIQRFKTGRATQRYVLLPTKISRYRIIIYRFWANETKQEKKKQGGISHVPETAASVASHRDLVTETTHVTHSHVEHFSAYNIMYTTLISWGDNCSFTGLRDHSARFETSLWCWLSAAWRRRRRG